MRMASIYLSMRWICRAITSLLPSDAYLSPSVGILYGLQAYVDFVLWPMRWAFELLVDGRAITENERRYRSAGLQCALLLQQMHMHLPPDAQATLTTMFAQCLTSVWHRRFEEDGQYGPMLQAQHIMEWAVIDMRSPPARTPLPRLDKPNTHTVLFSQDHRAATICCQGRQLEVVLIGLA